MKKGGEESRRVESSGSEIIPSLLLEDEPVGLVVPKYVEGLSLGIIVCADETHYRRLTRRWRCDDLLDEPAA